MPWLSYSPSPTESSSRNETTAPERDALVGASLSFVLPLRDSALGTTPLVHERPALHLLKQDARQVAAAVPRVLSALLSSPLRRQTRPSWMEMREILIYFIVSVVEAVLLVSILPLWLFTPGLVLLPWVCLQLGLIWLLLQKLNGTYQSLTRVSDAKGGEAETNERNERLFWIVVGGMDVTYDHMRRSTLPTLAKLFDHDMHSVFPYRLGFPLEIVAFFLRRSLQIPTSTSTTLYGLVRANLLRPHIDGVRILAHNTGALDTAWVLSRLCADLPNRTVLDKLEVFTFGAACTEMTTPLGVIHENEKVMELHQQSLAHPAITHFAFENDPFASIGVLPGIRQTLEGRYAGGLFTIGAGESRQCRWTMEDYVEALFPGGDPRSGVLGQTCRIDRETSEMRELAALAQSVNDVQLRMRKGTKRLSWTALGAVANNTSDGSGSHIAGVNGTLSLEETRRLGKTLQGMKGYENNPLAAAVRGTHKLSSDEAISVCKGKQAL